MFFRQKTKTKKIFTIIVSVLVIFQTIMPTLFAPKPANAVGLPVIDVASLTQKTVSDMKKSLEDAAKEARAAIVKKIWDGFKLSAALTLRNSAVMLSRKVAQDSMLYLASGGQGQSELFFTQSWEQFQKDVGDYVVGEVMDSLRDVGWDELGIDICNPSLNFKIQLSLGLDMRDQDRKKTDCTLANLKNNYGKIKDNVETKVNQLRDAQNPGLALSAMLVDTMFDVSMNRKSSDIGLYFTTLDYKNAQMRAKLEAEANQRLENLGGKTKTSLIGSIQTPAWLTRGYIMSETDKLVKEAPEGQAATAVMTDIPVAVVSAFLTTFVSEGLKEGFKALIKYGLTKKSEKYVPSAGGSVGYFDSEYASKKTSQYLNSNLQKVSVQYNSKEIDLISLFTSCPQDKGLYSCVMDQDFAQAVRLATQDKPITLREAIEQGYIDASKPIIHRDSTQNKLDECYEQGFCYSNLVKLRIARIIPVGWEIAASIPQTIDNNITLEYVMNQFDVDIPGQYNPYKGLVDPNWVFKYPQTKCNMEGYGADLIGKSTDERAEVCVDIQSCIQTDENGNCKSWGYCAAEKNIWQFGGDECFAPYDSCRSLVEEGSGNLVSYLTKTVNKSNCSADNAGCSWYSTVMEKNTDGIFNWLDVDRISNQDNIQSTKIRLDNDVKKLSCEQTSEGCTEFIRTESDMGTNIFPNSSFEEHSVVADGTVSLDGFPVESRYVLSDESFSGNNSVVIQADSFSSPNIVIAPKRYKRYFIVSAFVSPLSATDTLSFDLTSSSSAKCLSGNCYFANGTDKPANFNSELDPNQWNRIYALIEVGTQVSNLQFELAGPAGTLLDGFMVEEVSAPSLNLIHEYVEYGQPNQLNQTFLKKAPSSLACYDVASGVYGQPLVETDINKANDATGDETAPVQRDCNNFAGLCSANDIGCKAYNPKDGGNTVFGTTSFYDYCPSVCVGYNSYIQTDTFFANEAYPVYLIASSADVCTADAVGCEEFTNLDVLSAGGEGKEYYQELKQCARLPEARNSCSNFYTWVSDGLSGYTLKTYVLQDETKDNMPDLINESANYCNSAIFESRTNPDCKEFIAEDGSVSYALASLTITCSQDCHPYRRTIQYNTEDECTTRNGNWESGECIFMAIPNEGKVCSASNAGCKEYRGNYAGDEENIYYNTFETGVGDSLVSDNASTSTIESGAVLNLTSDATEIDNFEANIQTDSEKINLQASGYGSYLISFWGRATNDKQHTFDITIQGNSGVDITSPTENINNDWQYYTYNFNVDSSFDGSEEIGLHFMNASQPIQVQIDNLKITKVNDIQYLIKDSWNIPVSCDNELTYTPVDNNDRQMPYAMVGCREYTDNNQATHYLKGFSSLCAEDKVGCEALIDTKNSREYAPDPTVLGDNTMVSYGVDSLMYLINNSANKCTSSEKGCMAVGLPKLTAQTSITGTTTTTNITVDIDETGQAIYDTYFYKLSPDYLKQDNITENPLCLTEEEGCESYSGSNGDTYYFKKPYDQVCEYRDGFIASKNENGKAWFKKKTALDTYTGDIECAVADYYGDGVEHVLRNNDANYAGFVGTCASEANLCTAFIDPTDKTGSVVSSEEYLGKTYYYLNDESIDKRSCTSVDRENGCVLFNDTSKINADGSFALNPWNSFYTYYKTRYNGSPQSPQSFDFSLPVSLSLGTENGVFGFVGASQTEATACSSYTYCDLMEACLLKYKGAEEGSSNIVEKCVDELKNIDIYPNQAGKQYACSDDNDNSEDSLERNAWCTANNLMQDDTNVIIKVVKDKECAAWYECKSKHWVWDSNMQKYVEQCDSLGLCDQLGVSGGVVRCQHFLSTETNSNLLTQNTLFGKDGDDRYGSYQNRNTTWFDIDYTGYTLPDNTPLQYYTAVNIGGFTGARGFCRITKTDKTKVDLVGSSITSSCLVDSDCDSIVAGEASFESGECILNSKFCDGDRNLKACSQDTDCDDVGFSDQCKEPTPDYRLVNYQSNTKEAITCRADKDCYSWCDGADNSDTCRCVQGMCIQSMQPGRKIEIQSPEPECRLYPQKDSPFPLKVKNTAGFEAVNLPYIVKSDDTYSERSQMDYGCFYRQVSYGGVQKYFPDYDSFAPSEPEGFCVDNADIVCECDTTALDSAEIFNRSKSFCTAVDDVCGENGLCALADTENKILYKGLSGYCLQQDYSSTLYGEENTHPCLVWYPTGNLAGLNDLYETEEAGFTVSGELGLSTSQDAVLYYCLDAEKWEKRSTYTAVTQGYIDCWNGGVDGQVDTTSLYGWLAPNTRGGLNKFTQVTSLGGDTNMIDEKASDGNPSIYEEDWNPSEFFKYDDYLKWYKDSNNVSTLTDGSFPEVVNASPDYKYYFAWLRSNANNVKYDATTLSRAIVHQCGINAGGVAYLNLTEDQYDKRFTGPKCPDGYMPGRLSFFEYLETGGANWQTITIHHECVPEYIQDPAKYDSWYKSSSNVDYWQYSSNGTDITFNDNVSSINGSSNTVLSYGGPLEEGVVNNNPRTGKHTYQSDSGNNSIEVWIEPWLKFKDENKSEDLDLSSFLEGDTTNGYSEIDPRLYEIPAPICKTVVSIPNYATFYSDNYYKIQYKGDSAVVGNCAENPLTLLGSNVVKNDYQVDLATNPYITNTKSILGNLGWTGTDLDDFNVFMLYGEQDMGGTKYNYDDVVETQLGLSEYSLINNSDVWTNTKRAINDFDNLNYQNQTLSASAIGGLMCFADDRELNVSDNWQLRRLFNQASNKYDLTITDTEGAIDRVNSCVCAFIPDYTTGVYKIVPCKCGENESGNQSQCSDGIDNDGDGFVDNGLAPIYRVDADTGEVLTEFRPDIDCDTLTDVEMGDLSSSLSEEVKSKLPANYWGYDKKDLSTDVWNDQNKVNIQDVVYAPIVAGVVDTDQKTASGEKIWGASPNSLTLQNKNSGNIVLQASSFSANLKFYAWADKNAMPIKQVVVDWGDEKSKRTGSFRNQKPVCQSVESEKLGLCTDGAKTIPGYSCSVDEECSFLGSTYTCSDDKADRWGDTIQSCNQGYFSYEHTYICENPENQYDECLTENDSACWEEKDNDGIKWCRFKPRVMVKDNWDWCNVSGDTSYRGIFNSFKECDNAGQWYEGYIYMKPIARSNVNDYDFE